jgi:hypothetical protein
VARWATINHDRLIVTMLHNTVGVTLWFVFGAAVYAVLRDRLPTRSMLPMCFAASFFGCVILLLSGFTAFNLLLYRRHSAETSILLYDLTFGLLAMSRMPTVVALGSFAVAVRPPGVAPLYRASRGGRRRSPPAAARHVPSCAMVRSRLKASRSRQCRHHLRYRHPRRDPARFPVDR